MYQQKKRGQPWSEPQVLVVPPVQNYSIYYHKLSLDRLGRLFLSYSYRSSQVPYGVDFENAAREHVWRSMLFSDDGGATWRFPTTEAFAAGVLEGDDGKLRPGRVAGTVTDLDGSPVDGAQIEALQSVATDNEGRFMLDPVYVDSVPFAVTKDGYYPHLELVSLHDDQAVNLQVQLQPVLKQDVTIAQLLASNETTSTELISLPGRLQIHYTRRLGGAVTFDLVGIDASKSYRGVRFEARNESGRGTTVDLLATLHHSEGTKTESLEVRRVWDTYEIRLEEGAAERITLGLVGSDDTKVAIRNVKVMY